MKRNEIKAHIKTEWSYHGKGMRPRFLPGDKVRVVSEGTKYGSTFLGREGRVFGVTCGIDGKLRGRGPNGRQERMFTRYYVEFSDGTVRGFYSHYLSHYLRAR